MSASRQECMLYRIIESIVLSRVQSHDYVEDHTEARNVQDSIRQNPPELRCSELSSGSHAVTQYDEAILIRFHFLRLYNPPVPAARGRLEPRSTRLTVSTLNLLVSVRSQSRRSTDLNCRHSPTYRFKLSLGQLRILPCRNVPECDPAIFSVIRLAFDDNALCFICPCGECLSSVGLSILELSPMRGEALSSRAHAHDLQHESIRQLTEATNSSFEDQRRPAVLKSF